MKTVSEWSEELKRIQAAFRKCGMEEGLSILLAAMSVDIARLKEHAGMDND